MTSSLHQANELLRSHPDLLFRPAAERFHSRHGWLDSWHSFSFAGHFDPRWQGFGPLLVINDDIIAAGTGFGLHPHGDMEIITVMVDGVLTHRDSMGHAEQLRAGEVQRMSAGSGIVHSEKNESPEPCRLLQIWITPESTGLTPSYGQKPFPIGSGWTSLIDPDQLDGAMAICRQARLWRAQPQPGETLTLPLAAGTHGWIQIIDGAVDVDMGDPGAPGSGRLRRGDGLGLAAGALHAIKGDAGGADLLLFELG